MFTSAGPRPVLRPTVPLTLPRPCPASSTTWRTRAPHEGKAAPVVAAFSVPGFGSLPGMVHRLDRDEARRIAVRAQLLDSPRPADLVAMRYRLTKADGTLIEDEREAALAGNLQAARSNTAEVNRNSVELSALKREVESHREVYQTLTDRS